MKREQIKTRLFEKRPHFIGSWNIENDNLCKEMISCFEENKDLQKQGLTAAGKNLSFKKTTDISIKPNQLDDVRFKSVKKYITELNNCYVDYQNQWSFLKETIKEVDVGAFNLQKYSPGGHFSKIHTERSSILDLYRVFAWMTYLNDVDDGGITSFTHYNINIKPKTGLTLIWPAEWTHAHNASVLKSGVKYIATGWMRLTHNSD